MSVLIFLFGPTSVGGCVAARFGARKLRAGAEPSVDNNFHLCYHAIHKEASMAPQEISQVSLVEFVSGVESLAYFVETLRNHTAVLARLKD